MLTPSPARLLKLMPPMALVILPPMAACAVNKMVPVRLYDVRNAEVVHGEFQFRGRTAGRIRLTLPSGETFTGEYQTTRGGGTAWGAVYNSLVGTSHALAVVQPRTYTGTAIATSDRGRLMHCEYVTNTSRTSPRGRGACRDNDGRLYVLIFGET